MIRVAINGYGRIGRNILRAIYETPLREQITLVAINELAKPEAIAHLTQYDSTHGRFAYPVALDGESLVVDAMPLAYCIKLMQHSCLGLS